MKLITNFDASMESATRQPGFWTMADVVSDFEEYSEEDGAALEGLSFARSLEALRSVLVRMPVAFRDTVSNILFNKQKSELHHFMDLHKPQYKAVIATKYHKLMDMPVYTPGGMVSTYPISTDALKAMYEGLNIAGSFKELEKLTDELYRSLSRGSDDKWQILDKMLMALTSEGVVNSKARDVMVRMSNKRIPRSDIELSEEITNRTEYLFRQLSKTAKDSVDFSGDLPADRKPTGVFGKHFKNVKEFSAICEELMGMEPRLSLAIEMEKRTANINDTFENIIGLVESFEGESKEFVQKVAGVLRLLATYVSYYGYAVAAQLTLEHNIVLSIRSLYNTIS
jgi:hypothetical protein